MSLCQLEPVSTHGKGHESVAKESQGQGGGGGLFVYLGSNLGYIITAPQLNPMEEHIRHLGRSRLPRAGRDASPVTTALCTACFRETPSRSQILRSQKAKAELLGSPSTRGARTAGDIINVCDSTHIIESPWSHEALIQDSSCEVISSGRFLTS